MDMWNVSTETDKRTNNHVEGWNSKFAKVVGKHYPNIFKFMVAKHNAAVPSSHNKNNDDFRYILINKILYSVQLL